MSWASAELAKGDLGDARRNRCLVKIVKDFSSHPCAKESAIAALAPVRSPSPDRLKPEFPPFLPP